MRPVTLKIAVGPQDSDDVRLIQALAQAFSRDRNTVRMRAGVTDGAGSRAPSALRTGKADLAVIRGDLTVPHNARSVAVLHKNVAVLWVPAKSVGKTRQGRRHHQDHPAGRQAGRRHRPHRGQCRVCCRVILQQYGVDPAQGRNRAAFGQRGRRRGQEPQGRRLPGGRPAQQQDDQRGARRDGVIARREPMFLGDRFVGGDRRQSSVLRIRRRSRPARSAARRYGPTTTSRRSASRIYIVARDGVSDSHHRDLHPAIVQRPPDGDDRIPAGGARSRRPTPTRTR